MLVAAVPDLDPAAPWRIASEELPQPANFRVTTAAFDAVRHIYRDAASLTINDALIIQTTP